LPRLASAHAALERKRGSGESENWKLRLFSA